MVFWSCTIYEVNSEAESELKNFLRNWNKFVYDTIRFMDKELNLTLAVNAQNRNSYGELYSLDLDIPLKVRSREYGEFTVPLLREAHLQFYSEPRELKGLVAIFLSKSSQIYLIRAFKKLLMNNVGRTLTPFYRIMFRLRQKFNDLVREFEEVKEVKLSGIEDPYIKSMELRGERLDESDLMRTFIELSRRVESFAVTYEGKRYILSSDGSILTFQGMDRKDPIVVGNILITLHRLDAVERPRKLDMFL